MAATAAPALSKAARRRQRKLANKKKVQSQIRQSTERAKSDEAQGDRRKEEEDVVVEYVYQSEGNPQDAASSEFQEIFKRFAESGGRPGESQDVASSGDPEDQQPSTSDGKAVPPPPAEEKAESRRRRRLCRRPPIATLKQLCSNPEVVEVWDANAEDPELLVQLKSHRNTVPVPAHWSQKRSFLHGKRGIEKPPFKLPDFISATGIEDMRQTGDHAGEDESKLKSKSRERLNPKMGKIDIDYQVLHDAFFKHQKKPKLSHFGDVYYEGKEFEVELKQKRPGSLSREACIALGMAQDDQGGAKHALPLPPPWLINMQRYGPPPSYPSLTIPGLNAPIPEGCSFGFHPGGWGAPPVDETGTPLYGDVFGLARRKGSGKARAEAMALEWGAMDSEEESESEYEEVENPEDLESDLDMDSEDDQMAVDHGDNEDAANEKKPADLGLEGETTINLRKEPQSGFESEKPAPELYRVLEEKCKSVGKGDFMGSDKVYVMGESAAGGRNQQQQEDEGQQGERTPAPQQQQEKKKEKKKGKEFKF